MTHLWVRAEQRPNEERVGLTPEGAKQLIAKGIRVTVEESSVRAIPIDGYRDAGCEIAPENTWPEAPRDAIIFGLKELPEDGTPLPHKHIMFGHAYKGQHSGVALLKRFKAGGGTLYDLEYLVDDTGRRVAAFGYWAGYAGAAVTLKSWAAQQRGTLCGPVGVYANKDTLLDDLGSELDALDTDLPTAIVIGAGPRRHRCRRPSRHHGCRRDQMGHGRNRQRRPVPRDPATRHLHELHLRASRHAGVRPAGRQIAERQLTAIGDVACDPDSDYNPVPVYDKATTWEAPALRVHEAPVLDVMAIDNLPSMLPVESSEDYAEQLLATLLKVDDLSDGVWTRAEADFETHSKDL